MFLEAVYQLKNTSDCIQIDPPGPGQNLGKMKFSPKIKQKKTRPSTSSKTQAIVSKLIPQVRDKIWKKMKKVKIQQIGGLFFYVFAVKTSVLGKKSPKMLDDFSKKHVFLQQKHEKIWKIFGLFLTFSDFFQYFRSTHGRGARPEGAYPKNQPKTHAFL